VHGKTTGDGEEGIDVVVNKEGGDIVRYFHVNNL
jgi:hypothetical protein